jgi:hypothetical protein
MVGERMYYFSICNSTYEVRGYNFRCVVTTAVLRRATATPPVAVFFLQEIMGGGESVYGTVEYL